MPKGAIVGIIGGNGAGKSTLFKMITGQEQPDAGTVELGETVKISNVQQLRDELDDSKTGVGSDFRWSGHLEHQ